MLKNNVTSYNSKEISTQIDDCRKDIYLKAFEKWRKIGEIVTYDLKQRGQFFNTQQGLLFFDNEYLRAFPLHKDDIELAAIINKRYGINPKEYCFARILADLQTEAVLNGRQIEIRRLAFYDREGRMLYVSRFDGYMHRLDGESVERVPNGTDDVFFFDDHASWEPYSYTPHLPKGEFDRQLIKSVNFAKADLTIGEQRKLLKLWVLAVFFGSIQPTKIILLLLGDHGAGKTSALRRIQKFLFGRKVDLFSIEKDKQDGFIATITADPVALFDNLDERVGWLPYALSRLATGVTFSRRQLYTTNSKVEFPGVSWLGITCRTVRFMEEQPDLPDRTLVLRLDRLDDRQPEEELLEAVAHHRNMLWSELLDELNRIVRNLREAPENVRVRFRMADFASFALQVATIWDCRTEVEQIFTKLERAQSELVFEDEPIHQVLELWLQDPANYGRKVDAGTLQREWGTVATQHRDTWPFESGKSLGQKLGQLRHALKHRFDMEMTFDAHLKQYRYQFWPKGMAEYAPIALDDEVEPVAGFAGLSSG